MAEILYDVFRGLTGYLTTTLDIPVKVGYKDERMENEDDIVYPSASLILFDWRQDRSQLMGQNRVVTKDLEAGTATITRPPIPTRAFFQIDILAESKADDWALATRMKQILETRFTKIITEDEREIYLYPFTNDTVDSYIDGVFRKAFRFYTDLILDDLTTPKQAYLVLQLVLDMQGEDRVIQDVT